MNQPKFDIQKYIADFNETHAVQLEFARFSGGEGFQLFIKGDRGTGLKCSKSQAVEIVNFLKQVHAHQEVLKN